MTSLIYKQHNYKKSAHHKNNLLAHRGEVSEGHEGGSAKEAKSRSWKMWSAGEVSDWHRPRWTIGIFFKTIKLSVNTYIRIHDYLQGFSNTDPQHGAGTTYRSPRMVQEVF